MLSKNTSRSMFSIAEQLAIHGQRITPIMGSDLAEPISLTQVSPCGLDRWLKEDKAIDPNNLNLSYLEDSMNTWFWDLEASTEGGAIKTPHSVCFDDKVNKLKPIIENIIDITKNTIKPLVQAYFENVNKRLEAYRNSNPSNDFTIKGLVYPKLLNIGLFTDELSKFNNTVSTPPSRKIRFPDLPESEIKNLLLTGNNTYDTAILSLIGNLSDGYIKKIWNSFINSPDTYIDAFTYRNISENLTVIERVEIHLITYLISNNLYNTKPIEGVTNIDLGAYKDILASIRNFNASNLAKLITYYEETISSRKTIVLRILDKTAYVDDVNYKEWLAAGNLPEYLLGLIVTYNNNKDIGLNLEKYKPEEIMALHSAFHSYLNLQNSKLANDQYSECKRYLVEEFEKLMLTLSDKEKSLIKDEGNYKATIYQKFRENVSIETLINPALSTDLYEVCAEILCVSRFYYMPSARALFKIMKEIDSISDNMYIVSSREKAALAIYYLIIDYLCEQLIVSPSND